MNKYNLDKLVKVSLLDFRKSGWYSYKTEKRFLGFITRKAGIYELSFLGDKDPLMEIPKDHVFEDGIVYIKPSVVLHYQADHSKEYFFETFKDAMFFSEQITSVGRWQS